MKKQVYIKYLALICAAAMLMTGCGKKAETPVETVPQQEEKPLVESPEDTEASTDETAEQAYLEIPSYDYGEVLAEDGTVVLTWNYSIPQIELQGSQEAEDKIAQHFRDEIDAAMAEISQLGEEAKEFYAEQMKYMEEEKGIINDDEYADMWGDYTFPAYEYSLGFRISRNDEKVVSLEKSVYSYLGGAHGGTMHCGVTWNAQTGEEIGFSELGRDTDALRKVCVSTVDDYLASTAYEDSLFITPHTEKMTEYLTGQFDNGFWYLDRGGIIMIANEYDIASYADGDSRYVIPYTDIELDASYAYDKGMAMELICDCEGYPGRKAFYDLDGDGVKENIYVNYENDWETGEGTCNLIINDVDYSQDILDAMGYWLCPSSTYFIVDMDQKDKFCDIVLTDWGPSDDPTSIIMRYEAGTLSYLGNIPTGFDDVLLNGDGTMEAYQRTDFPETSSVLCKYSMNSDGKVQKVEEEWHTLRSGLFEGESKHMHPILRMFEVYKEKDLNAETVALYPEDGSVSFERTDLEKWVVIQLEDGTEYYMAMEGWGEIRSGEATLEIFDVFDNLIFAD